ncbi:thiopurine s-methyltransferase family [Pyrenophora seminiperda CCB06]|uniref:Thiopurine s-methyltransferase family n=1 Tax=Pyrenophora seminiperda CCB06 TaxID=1302712 RepID=A0A3M7M901_9PLEO|nr:thiopurine s-methyltransferase family [Pyrenophora seminiperda CCB06]
MSEASLGAATPVTTTNRRRTRDAQSDGWAKLWENNESGLWDRGRPSPALITFLDQHAFRETLLRDHGKRVLNAFVPVRNFHSPTIDTNLSPLKGCGKGHDVALLARHGYRVWGLEVSQGAVDAANENVKAQLKDSNSHDAHVILGDFFKKDYETQFGPDFRGFDLIYDYTFLCALLPEMRKGWAERMESLLSPGGFLVCLEFPMWKPLKAQGPPWGLKGVHWNLLADGADGLFDESGNLIGTGQEKGVFERVVYWKPPESFEQGRGEDMISVWKLK